MKNYHNVNEYLKRTDAVLIVLIILLLSLSLKPISAANPKTDLECLAGNCGINLKISVEDINQSLPEEAPHILCTLDTRPLKVNNSPTYRILAYEIVSNQNRIIADTKIDFPVYKANIRDQKVILRLIPKNGNRQLYIAVHDSSGGLAALYRANLNSSGQFTANSTLTSSSFVSGTSLLSDTSSTTATEIIPGYRCNDSGLDDCNVEALFFKKLVFESDRRRKANQTYVVNESDGAFKIQIPVQPGKDREKIKRPAPKFVIDNDITVMTVPETLSSPLLTTNTLRIGLNPDHADLTYKAATDEFTIQVNDATPILRAKKSGEVGIKTSSGSLSQLDIGASNIPQIALRDANLAPTLMNGAFEFTGTGLYFTSGGVRRFILLDPTNPNAPSTAPTANLVGSLDANLLDNKSPVFFTNVSNINAGTLSQERLPADIGAIFLKNELSNKNLVMQGSHNITLTSQNNSEYILPISGTLATTDDLLPNNSVTTSNIINGTIQGIDIANNTLDDTKIAADLSATKVTSGVINKNRLPNRDIVNINNLTTVLGGKLVKFDIANNLISTNVDKPLSANQGKVLKDLLDSKTQFTTDKQILGGVNLDFTINQSFLTKVMTANTSFTASNLKQGNRILLELSGNFNIILPSYFQTLTGAYDGTKINLIELEVINDSLTTPLVYIRIFN
jgi:hypothetical protein